MITGVFMITLGNILEMTGTRTATNGTGSTVLE